VGRYLATDQTAQVVKSAPPTDSLSYDTATGAGLPTFTREKCIVAVEWSYDMSADWSEIGAAAATARVEIWDGTQWVTVVNENVSATSGNPSDAKMDSGKSDIEVFDVQLSALQVRCGGSATATGSNSASSTVDITAWRVLERRNRTQNVGPY
jgi:hypothetical protein